VTVFKYESGTKLTKKKNTAIKTR